ncbi:hypothetical protein Zmor_013235 [Zophobas morio]|uniref:Division abnormally delayed protein n=1 Tax=Zophobas morio TaxID=2755281 RepID=A0AA38MFB7_9CUCU|nr:hypothetical protein Zmor_013235 [Zophobas morio]
MNTASVATLFVCWCVLMVSAKSAETSGRPKRTATPASCENVKEFFLTRNLTVPTLGKKGSVCGGECCVDEAEDLLRKQGQKDFATLLRHNSRSLQGLLSFTAASLQNHVSELSRQSENKTLLLFTQVYKGMAVLSKDPIAKLYSDIRSYILVNSTKTDLAATSIDIKGTVSHFFTNFFPLVYHHILHINGSQDFASDYKECLKKSTETISPFGDIPKQISQSLSKSLEATRLLLQAFAIGREVLNTTDRLLVDESGKSNAECHQALLKMHHCPKCLGMGKNIRPCSGYCLNVLRGCLTKYVAELDSPWNGYVEGIEGLINAMKKNREDAGVNADLAIRSLDSKISEAIMRAMQKMKDIDMKVSGIEKSRTTIHHRQDKPRPSRSVIAINFISGLGPSGRKSINTCCGALLA